MKKSTIFWIIVGVIALICYNIFWYNYELKYANDPCRSCSESPYTVLVGMYGGLFDFIFVLGCITFFVPKFNKWMDTPKNSK